MTNKDLCFMAIIAGLLIIAWAWAERHPARFLSTGPALPINLKTNGVADGNTNNVANRVNFQQQPYGSSSS